MSNKKGFTIVEILVVVVILAVVGLVIMMSIIPQIEQNAKDSFISDIKLYLQASTKEITDSKIEGEEFTSKCISVADLNKKDVGVADKKSYMGYIVTTLDAEDNTVVYNIAITNKKFYTYNRIDSTFLVDGSEIDETSILDNYGDVKDFPSKCPSK